MICTLLLLFSSFVQRLQALPGVDNVQTHTYKEILPDNIRKERKPYYDSARTIYTEYISFTIEQPIDHRNPEFGTFKQRIELQLTDLQKPVVLLTEGYHRPNKMRLLIDPIALHLHANTIAVEHRYFGHSKPEDKEFAYLDTYQAAADWHRVYTLLSSIFNTPWIATGTSKSGISTTLFAYYFPNDMKLYVPFMAPFCESRHDLRVGKYITQFAGTSTQRDTIRMAKQYALTQVPNMAKEICKRLKCKDLLTTDSTTVYANIRWLIFEHFFHQWSYIPVSSGWIKQVPVNQANAKQLVDYYIGKKNSKEMKKYKPIGPQYDLSTPIYPYYIQAMRELGHYIHDVNEFRYLGATDEDYTIDAQVSYDDRIQLQQQEMDNRVMMDIANHWIYNTSCRMIFVYGANDPWTGAGINPDIHNKNNNITYYLIDEGIHSPYLITYINQKQVEELLNEIDNIIR